jgi:hypothetical protein
MDGDILACGWEVADAPGFKGLDSTKDHLVWQRVEATVEATGIGVTNYANLIFNNHRIMVNRKRNLPFRDSKVIVRAKTFGVQILLGLDKGKLWQTRTFHRPRLMIAPYRLA